MSHKITDWLTYNGNEYTVNGKTYRNLEEQVKRNQELSLQAIDITEAMQTDVNNLSSEVTNLNNKSLLRVTYNPITGVCDKTMGDIITHINNGGLIYLITNNPSNKEVYALTRTQRNGNDNRIICTKIDGDADDPFVCYLESDYCADNEYPTVQYTETFLGKGDIAWVTYNETTLSEILGYASEGKIVLLKLQGMTYIGTQIGGTLAMFTLMRLAPDGGLVFRGVYVNNTDEWGVITQFTTVNTITDPDSKCIPTVSAVTSYISNNTLTVTLTNNGGTITSDHYHADIDTAITAGKEVICKYDDKIYRYACKDDTLSTDTYVFVCTEGYLGEGKIHCLAIETSDDWYDYFVGLNPGGNAVIQTSDKLVIGRRNNNGQYTASGTQIAFDTTQTDKFLCQDGTWKAVSGGGGVPLRTMTTTAIQHTIIPTATIEVEVNP